jgi:hypothetical protein
MADFLPDPRWKGILLEPIMTDGAIQGISIIRVDEMAQATIRSRQSGIIEPGFVAKIGHIVKVFSNTNQISATWVMTKIPFLDQIKACSASANALEDAHPCGDDQDKVICLLIPVTLHNQLESRWGGIVMEYSLGSATHEQFMEAFYATLFQEKRDAL